MEKPHAPTPDNGENKKSPQYLNQRLAEISQEIEQLEQQQTELQRLFMRGEISDHYKNPRMEQLTFDVARLKKERDSILVELDGGSVRRPTRMRRFGRFLLGSEE